MIGFKFNLDFKLLVMYERRLPLSNKIRTCLDLDLSSLKAVALAVCKRTVPWFLTVLVVVVLLNPPSGGLVVGFSSLRGFDGIGQID